MKRALPLLLLFICFSAILRAQCLNGRYYDKLFSVSSTTNVLYGNAMKFDSTYQDLKMNIYEPSGDLFAHRPLIVLAFGGSFTAGVKESPDILNLCNEFAQRGYVTATIDYRLGFEDGNDSDTNQFKALIRGVQDMKAAVRFFYKDANTTNTYRIDTNQIFIGGVSAGAFIGLNYGYGKLDTLSKPAPPFAIPALLALGGPEGNSGNAGYSSKVKGVIDLCGAIADTVWIMPTDPILVGVHGLMDDLVSCQWDSATAAQSVEASLYGTCDIEKRVSNIGLPHSLYFFEGMGHVPFILPTNPIHNPLPYMDTTVRVIRDFLAPHTVCDTTLISGVEALANNINATIYPNPAGEQVYISSAYGTTLQAQLLTLQGQQVWQQLLPAGYITAIHRTEVAAGMYLLKLTDAEHPGKQRTERVVFW